MCRQIIFLVAAVILFDFCSAEYVTPYKSCNNWYAEAECYLAESSSASCLAQSRCRWGYEHDGHAHGDEQESCYISNAEEDAYDAYLDSTWKSASARAAGDACVILAEAECTGDCAMFDGACLPTAAKFNSLGYDDEPGANTAIRQYRCTGRKVYNQDPATGGQPVQSLCEESTTCHWDMGSCEPTFDEAFRTEQCQAAMALMNSPASMIEFSAFVIGALVIGTLASF